MRLLELLRNASTGARYEIQVPIFLRIAILSPYFGKVAFGVLSCKCESAKTIMLCAHSMDGHGHGHIFTQTAPTNLARGGQGPVHTSWGSAHAVASRGSTPARFSSQTPLSLSPRFMAPRHPRRKRHDGVVQGAPSHHRAQGASFNPFGGHPPLSDHTAPLRG